MVFATGTGDKAQAATEIMNRHGAVEVEKISASRPELPRTDHGEVRLPRTIFLSKLEGSARRAPVLACSCGSTLLPNE